MEIQRSISFAANPSSVTIQSGKTVSRIVQLSVGSIQANSHITKIAVSYMTSDTAKLKDSSGINKHTTTGANVDTFVVTDGWKNLNDSSWASSNYSLSVKFGRSTSSGTLNVSNIRYDVYYYVNATCVTQPSNVKLGSYVAQTTTVLSWSHGQDGQSNAVTGYQIQRRNSASGNFDNIDWSDYVTTGKVTSYNVQPLGERGSFTQFRIRSLGQIGQSGFSQYVILGDSLRKNTLPNAPVFESSMSSVFQDRVNIKWMRPNDSTGSIVGYKVYMSLSNTYLGPDYQMIDDVKSTQFHVSCQVSVKSERGNYVGFFVSAYDQFGAEGQASYCSLMRNTRPVIPGEMSASTYLYSFGDITLSWEDATDQTDAVVGYRLQTRHGNDNNLSSWQSTDLGLQNSITVTPNYADGQVVNYRVCAYDTFDVQSNSTPYISIRINKPPVTGGAFTVVPSNYAISDKTVYQSGYINLEWGKSRSDYSTIDHYRFAYSFSSDGIHYGNWIYSKNIYQCNAVTSFSLSVFQRGCKARFMLYAYDSTGKYSVYNKVCYLTRNVVPGLPQLVFPSSSLHYSHPLLIISVPKSENKLNRNLLISNGTSNQHVYNIGLGESQMSVRLQDSVSQSIGISIQDQFGVQSEVLSVSIECAAPEWTRQIGPGTVIANTSISHRADLNEMLQQVNVSRNAYGMQDVEFSESVGYFANWITNATDIYNGIAQVYDKLGMSYDSFPAYTNSYPQASIINFLRMMIEGV